MDGMRELLRRNLGRSLQSLTPSDRLAAAWPVVCGSALSGHARVIALLEGVLEIATEDDRWQDEFTRMRSVLEAELARTAAVPLKAIHFYPEGRRPGPRPPAPSAGPAGNPKPKRNHR